MKYLVEISETLQRKIIVEADSQDEARQKTEDMYYNSEIVLDADDIVDGLIGFSVVKEYGE